MTFDLHIRIGMEKESFIFAELLLPWRVESHTNILDKIFKNEPSKICAPQILLVLLLNTLSYMIPKVYDITRSQMRTYNSAIAKINLFYCQFFQK